MQLVRLDERDELVSSPKSAFLAVQRRRGRPKRIVLRKREAEECFHALRQMCPRAAAIEFDQSVYEPISAEHAREGRAVLAAALLRQARWNTVVAIAMGMVTALIVLGMLSVGANLAFRHVFTIGLPLLGGLAAGWRSIHLRKLRRLVLEHERDDSDVEEKDGAEPAAEMQPQFVAEADQTGAGWR